MNKSVAPPSMLTDGGARTQKARAPKSLPGRGSLPWWAQYQINTYLQRIIRYPLIGSRLTLTGDHGMPIIGMRLGGLLCGPPFEARLLCGHIFGGSAAFLLPT